MQYNLVWWIESKPPKSQFAVVDGKQITWSPKQKQATALSWAHCISLLRRLVGGNVVMQRIPRKEG